MDRFGDYNEVVGNLLDIAELKMYADYALVEKIHQAAPKVTITFSPRLMRHLKVKNYLKRFPKLSSEQRSIQRMINMSFN